MGVISNIRNYFFPVAPNQVQITRNEAGVAKDLRYQAIAPIIFERTRQDILKWRESIREAEAGIVIMRQRVRMQQNFLDTVLNSHVDACMRMRKSLVLQKEFDLVDAAGNINEQATELIRKDWFHRVIEGRLDALFFGYTLMNFSDIVNNELFSRDSFGNLVPIKIIPRPWVSPDRLKVANIPYNIGGIPFRDISYIDDFGNCPFDWTFYFSTPSEIGVSECGYGILYKVAIYEIYLRNLIGQYSTFVELYGSPMRHGKTMKTGDERTQFFNDLVNMGSSATVVTDIGDEIEFIESKSAGSGWESYDHFREWLEKSISKMILGHADAMDSTPGKLGASEEVNHCIKVIESSDCRGTEQDITMEVLPKLRKMGMAIPEGLRLKFRNVHEQEEFRKKEDDSNKATADIVKVLADAGYKVEPDYITQRTGIPVEASQAVEAKNAAVTAESINNLYKGL